MKVIVKTSLALLFLILISSSKLLGQIKVDANGYVGIHSPETIKGFLHINGGNGSFSTAPRIDISSSGTSIISLNTSLSLYNNDLTAGNWNRLQFATMMSNGEAEDFAAVAVEYMNRTNGAQSGDMHLATVNLGEYASRFSILSTSTANQVKFCFNTGSSQSGDGVYLYTYSAQPAFYPITSAEGYLGAPAHYWKYVYATNLYYTSTCAKYSDLRLKTDISNIDGSSLDRILKLKGVKYRLKSEVDNETAKGNGEAIYYLGFIAQEVKDIIPEVVLYDKENDLYSIDYTSIIPVMVEAIKTQQKKIDELEVSIAAIEERLKKLEKNR